MLVDVHKLALQYLRPFLLRSGFGILCLGRRICLTSFALMDACSQENGHTLTILITVHPGQQRYRSDDQEIRAS